MNNMTVIETINLTKKFKDKTVVDNLTIKVSKGDIYGFLGPNGSGKSTTIKMLLGLIRPTSGTVKINGDEININKELLSLNIGAVIETPAFYEDLTAKQNLNLFCNMYPSISKETINEVLKLVNLDQDANKIVKRFSLGMKQRLGIARAFLHNPEIIILDEPTNGLDPYGMREVRELILRLASVEKKTFFISTHLLYEVQQICNKVAIIKNGKLAKECYVKELLENTKNNQYNSLENSFFNILGECENYV